MATAKRYTDFPNGIKSFPRANNTTSHATNQTISAADCLGLTKIFTGSSGATVTLPILTGVVGAIVTIVNNTGALMTIDPNAADGIAFAGNVTDGKSILNSLIDTQKGDYVTLASIGAGATAATFWTVVAIGGKWQDGS